MEKLSSGLRINRAGDDAAGLAISEKMRGQIRGLNQASSNAQDGISLIQTAEGALNETHAILQRMRELAVQSSTDTNTNADRGEIQKEVDELAQEITRIAETTQFNTMNLLDGGYDGKKFHIGANQDQSAGITIADMSSSAIKVEGFKGAAVAVGANKINASNRTETELTIAFTAAQDKDGTGVEKTTAVRTGDTITVTLKQEAGNGTTAGKLASNDELKAALESVGGLTIEVADGYKGDDAVIIPGANVTVTAGVSDKTIGIDVLSQTAANKSITTINSALETVSGERSKLGAMQNRLEHTIKNLDTSAENLQASEARIRDVDMAKEMMEQTRNNILQQASTAMLAQANQAPQQVLQLLR